MQGVGSRVGRTRSDPWPQFLLRQGPARSFPAPCALAASPLKSCSAAATAREEPPEAPQPGHDPYVRLPVLASAADGPSEAQGLLAGSPALQPPRFPLRARWRPRATSVLAPPHASCGAFLPECPHLLIDAKDTDVWGPSASRTSLTLPGRRRGSLPPHSWPLAAPRFPHLCQRQLLLLSSSGPKPWSQFSLFSFHQLLYPIRQQLLRVLSSKYLQTLKPACGAASLGTAPGFPVKPHCRRGVVGEGKGRDYCQAPKAGNSGRGGRGGGGWGGAQNTQTPCWGPREHF